MKNNQPKQERLDFDRIAIAIGYIEKHLHQQPSLEDIAAVVRLSPFHFQRLFTAWAGTSPKKFLQYLSLDYAKQLLKQGRVSVLEATLKTGLSGPSRLHDLFVTIEGMTPGEYKNGGEGLRINYQFEVSPFGQILIASTTKGICHLAFVTDRERALSELRNEFPNARFINTQDDFQHAVLRLIGHDDKKRTPVPLHLKGTDFQLKVWEMLLRIPFGQLSTYGTIARAIDRPRACRAVGTAVGENPVAILIPCHRVIQSTGAFGNYRGGKTRKLAIIGWEAAQQDEASQPKT